MKTVFAQKQQQQQQNTITTRRQKLTKGWGFFFLLLILKSTWRFFFSLLFYRNFLFFSKNKKKKTKKKPQSIIMDIYICRNFPWGLRIRKLGYKLPELIIGFHFQFNHKIYKFIYFSYLRRFYDNLSRTYKYREPLIFYWSHFSFYYFYYFFFHNIIYPLYYGKNGFFTLFHVFGFYLILFYTNLFKLYYFYLCIDR